MRNTLALVLSLVLVMPMSTIAQPADAILHQMAHTYSTLASYTDTGAVRVLSPGGDLFTETTFETAFARPKLFRFAWVAHHPDPRRRGLELRSVIWSDGTRAYEQYGTAYAVHSQLGKVQVAESLGMAIAGATGVSEGAAHTVPRLLMPEIEGFSLEELQTPVIVAIEDIEGTACYHIRGSHPTGGKIDIWLGNSDYLIRVVQMQLAGMLQREIRRDIRTNEPIPAAKFVPHQT
jgi:hypothetical protein